MNLTELQIQLRNVENQISQLSAEIEKMKSEKQELKIDYDAITRVAKQYPVNELDICHAPEQLRKDFVIMLMYLFVSDDRGLPERLLYLTRLAVGCKLQMDAKDVYQSAHTIEMDDVERLSNELADYRYSFVIEAFVVANLCEEIDKDAWTLLADVAQLMKCDEEEIVVLSHVAKYRLTGDTRHLDEIPLPKTNRWSAKLREYIPRKWVESKRKNAITICTDCGMYHNHFMVEGKDKYIKIKEGDKLPNDTIVRLGDIVVTYCEMVMSSMDEFSYTFSSHSEPEGKVEYVQHTVAAQLNGVVYWWEGGIPLAENKEEKRNCMEAYIVSPFDDYDSFKSWADNR